MWGEGKPLLLDETSALSIELDKEQPLKRELAHFLRVIKKEDELVVKPMHGYDALKIALDADRMLNG
mgnify:CR=1 FL=1